MLETVSHNPVAVRYQMPGDGVPLWAAYGLTIASRFEFRSNLGRGTGAPDLTLEVGALPRACPPSQDLQPLFDSSREHGANAATLPAARLYRTGAADILSFPDIGDYYLGVETIHCQVAQPSDLDLVELRFLGPVLSYWLERMGVAVLHASAVVVDGRALAFLGSRGSGKSTLAAAFLAAGHDLLTDDLLALEIRGRRAVARPGYPQLRVWPDTQRHLFGDSDGLEPVHPLVPKTRVPVGDGRGPLFRASTTPVAAILVLSPLSGSGRRRPSLREVGPSAALGELVANSFTPRLAHRARPPAERLTQLARIVQEIPLLRLEYRHSWDDLAETVDGLAESVGRGRDRP